MKLSRPRIPASHTEEQVKYESFSEDYVKNIDMLKELFYFPENQDFIIRELFIDSLQKKATLLFLTGMSDVQTIESEILTPLMQQRAPLEKSVDSYEISSFLKNHIMSSQTVEEVETMEDGKKELLMGNSLLLVEGSKYPLRVTASGFEKRSVDRAQDENILKGPKEAFIESINVNISLVRKQLRSNELITEYLTVGESGLSKVALLSMKDTVNPQLVEKVKKRISQIKKDEIQNLAILEQHLEERPYSIVPTILYTERPDRAVSFLREGHIVILMDSSPSCLIAPVTFWSLFHTSEDYYSKWAYGNFSRIIRILAIFTTILTPAIYIAATNFHIEMLPTDLVLAISATRERVPFPAIFEVVLLLVAFELIREGGIRVPSPIGPTIGIVGALILGQAAVEANIISPILVIVIAVTGLASFAVPNLSFTYMIRLSTYIFLVFGAFWGLFGIALCMTMSISYLTSVKSFDVPFLSPMAPHYPSSKDMIIRPPLWKMWLRPLNIFPAENKRMSQEEEDSK
ncbi:spore germination protein [Metabacillus sp. HB246100]